MSLRAWWHSADSSVKVHRWLKWLWIILLPVVFMFKDSVWLVTLMSWLSLVLGSWSAEQSGIVEKKQEQAQDP